MQLQFDATSSSNLNKRGNVYVLKRGNVFFFFIHQSLCDIRSHFTMLSEL